MRRPRPRHSGRHAVGSQARGAAALRSFRVPSVGMVRRLTSPRRIATDLASRVVGQIRQRTIAKGDPLHFEPCIEHHGSRLGLFHLYTPVSDQQTTDWLESPVYVGEAEKRHAIDACHLALTQFHAFVREGDLRARAGFLASARALRERGRRIQLDGRDCFVLPHVDQVDEYRPHHKPWIMSMAQGWAAGLFMRAYQLDGDRRFLDAARLTTGPFFVDVERGGILGRLAHGAAFYEKYPFPGQVRHVLNGFMSSLFNLYDLARTADDDAAHELFAAGIATLSDPRTMHAFDNGYSTLYDLGGSRRATPSGVFYTWVHARQLAGLSRITGEPGLMRWAERWRDYVFKRRYTLRSGADCAYFRARRVPMYVRRSLEGR